MNLISEINAFQYLKNFSKKAKEKLDFLRIISEARRNEELKNK